MICFRALLLGLVCVVALGSIPAWADGHFFANVELEFVPVDNNPGVSPNLWNDPTARQPVNQVAFQNNFVLTTAGATGVVEDGDFDVSSIAGTIVSTPTAEFTPAVQGLPLDGNKAKVQVLATAISGAPPEWVNSQASVTSMDARLTALTPQALYMDWTLRITYRLSAEAELAGETASSSLIVDLVADFATGIDTIWIDGQPMGDSFNLMRSVNDIANDGQVTSLPAQPPADTKVTEEFAVTLRATGTGGGTSVPRNYLLDLAVEGQATSVPEPASLALISVVGLLVVGRRRVRR